MYRRLGGEELAETDGHLLVSPFGNNFVVRVVRYHFMFRSRNNIFFLLPGLMFALASGTVFANGMRLVSQDGLATARGEAFVATADNASAVYYNPAGISQISGDQVRIGVYGINFNPTFQPPHTAPNSGNTYHAKQTAAVAPQLPCDRRPAISPSQC